MKRYLKKKRRRIKRPALKKENRREKGGTAPEWTNMIRRPPTSHGGKANSKGDAWRLRGLYAPEGGHLGEKEGGREELGCKKRNLSCERE